MTLLARLARLIQANLRGRSTRRSQEAGHEWRQYSTSSGNGAQGSQTHQAGHDPLLARYYANLELPYGADLTAVRQAWKKLLRQYHPDLHSHDPEKRRIATELTQGLNRAYEELEKRLTSQ